MAITAKSDIFSVPAGTAVDVQPPVSEVWLIKSLLYVGSYAEGSPYIRVSLWDGTDEAPFFDYTSDAGASYFGAGIIPASGQTAAVPRVAGGFAEWSVVVTNTNRMRFIRWNAAKMGYSGVQLA